MSDRIRNHRHLLPWQDQRLMAHKRRITRIPYGFEKWLTMPAEKVIFALAGGAVLELVESSLSDPEDYCALELDGQRIATWPGY